MTRNPITHPITNQEFLKSPLYAPLQPYLWVQDKDKPTDYARASAYRLANPSWLVQDPVRLSKILGIPCKSITVSAPNGLPELSRTHAHVTNAHVTNAMRVSNIRGRRAYTQLISLCFIRIDLLIYLRAIALGVIPHGVNRNDIPQGTLSKLYLTGQGVYANQRSDTDYDYFGLPAKSPNSSIVYDDTLSTVLQTGDLSILTKRIKSLTDPNGPYYLATERAKPHMLWFFYNSSKAGVPIAKDALSILDAHAGLLEQQNREIYNFINLGNSTHVRESSYPGLIEIVKAQRAQGKTGQGLPNLCHFIPHSLIRFLVEDVLAKKDIHNRLGMGLQSNPTEVVLRNCVSLLQKISNQGPQFSKRLMQQNFCVESLGSSLAPLYTVPARSLPGKTPTNLTELSEELTKAFGAALDRGINERYPTMASLGMQSLSRYNSCFWIPRNIAADMIADEIECSIRSL